MGTDDPDAPFRGYARESSGAKGALLANRIESKGHARERGRLRLFENWKNATKSALPAGAAAANQTRELRDFRQAPCGSGTPAQSFFA